jgi:hypothetical protein
MPALSIHIGPGKCGSTSIQAALTSHHNKFRMNTVILNPADINAINKTNADKTYMSLLESKLNDLSLRGEMSFLSHEMLFKTPIALENIVRIADRHFESINVVGYSRRQSDFLKSAYSQWHFRSRERTREISDVLGKFNIDSGQFNGLERFYIGAVYSNMNTARQLDGTAILHWGSRYAEINEILSYLNATVSVGYIPNRDFQFSLVEDFYKKCGIADYGFTKSDDRHENAQYCPDLIEATNIALMHGAEVPGPHDFNGFFETVRLVRGAPDDEELRLIEKIKSYVDCFFLEENISFCEQFGLDPLYFSPRSVVSKSEVDEFIRDQSEKRRSDPGFAEFRSVNLSASLFANIFQNYIGKARPPG